MGIVRIESDRSISDIYQSQAKSVLLCYIQLNNVVDK